MGLVSSNIPNLVGGVSQQPAAIRRENQFESQTNAYSTLVEGLSPRRPSYHVAKLIAEAVGPGAFWHFIARDLEEHYVVCIRDGDLRVFDLDTGTELVVTFPDGYDYLDVEVPRTAFKAITVADYTFIVNTTVEVFMDAPLTPSQNPECLLYVKQGNYGKNYAVYINGVTVASYSTPDGSVSSHSYNIDTGYIAGELVTDIVAALPGWTVTQYGPTIHVRAPTATDFTIAVADGYAGLALLVAKTSVQKFTDLPNNAPDGFVIGVSGDKGVDGDIYYLKHVRGYVTGVWEETVAPNIEYQIDRATMPWQLIRNEDLTFTFQQAAWEDRGVGDELTNPDPSFVGRTISDVFFSRNRLGFVAGENAASSRSGEFFHFFRRTCTTLLDDDPVDVAVSSMRVSNVNWAVPFNKALVLFSERGQFEMGSADILTPRSVAIVPTSEYESSPYARPATTGTSVFFGVEQDGFVQVREYYDNGQSASRVQAYNTTEHCPRYLPEGLFKLTASRSEDLLAALTTGDPTAVYVYRYFGSPDDRIQSAWTRWDLVGDVLSCEFIKADLHCIVERDGEVWLEKIPLASGKTDIGVDYLTYLDRRTTDTGLTKVYNFDLDQTAITLPYAAEGVSAVVRYDAAYAGTMRPGQTVNVLETDELFVILDGDHTETPIIFGFPIETVIEMSKIFPRERRSTQNSSKTTIIDGRLQVRYLTLLVGNTSSFRVTVQPAGRPLSTKVFNGRVVGSSTTVIGDVPLYSGKVRVPVLGRGDSTVIKIIHDSHLPMNILAMEWEGLFSIRSQRSA